MIWGQRNYQTWINHGLIAAAFMVVFALVLPADVSAYLAVWGYLFRELDQHFGKLFSGEPIPWLDAVMDVVSPVLTCTIMWLILK